MSVNIYRQSLKITPDPSRVILKFFFPGPPERSKSLIKKVMNLSREKCKLTLNQTLREFSNRHRNISQVFEKHFNNVFHLFEELNIDISNLPIEKKLIIGSYFTAEYAIEAAAIFNPSVIEDLDQTNLEHGKKRVIFSLRATGEGHISSIVFRGGIINKDGTIELDPPGTYVDQPMALKNHIYNKTKFLQKLEEMNVRKDVVNNIFDTLPGEFEYKQLDAIITSVIQKTNLSLKRQKAIQTIIWVADSHYEIKFSFDTSISERVLYPVCDFESNGIEDARFVKFTDDDGSIRYYATYTAYNGSAILPKLLVTSDFYKFNVMPIHGKMAHNKGMALFPRKINGKYAMISRIDGLNNYIMFSDNINVWETSLKLQSPEFPWELVQIGNCGSPIETDEGWLLLTHGVGPMRKYSIGAVLLDLNDPTKMIGKLESPLLIPNEAEREGYVPNVVYSCGSIIHLENLIIPYAMSDTCCTFASVPIQPLLKELKESAFKNGTRKTPHQILLVEDNISIQKVIKLILESNNYVVSVADNGVEALLLMVKQKFDLVVSDVSMPNLNGFELAEFMKDNNMDIPLIYISENASEQWVQEGVIRMAREILPKPIDKEQLLLKLDRILNPN